MFKPKKNDDFSRLNKGWLTARKSVFLGLALSLAICGSPNLAFAGAESDPNLTKLEVKLFQHDFSKEDDVDARLERLEKMVFGEAKTGDSDQRLKNLVTAVPNLDANVNQSPKTAASQPAQSSDDSSADSSAPSGSSGTASRPEPKADLADKEKDIQDSSQYPAVTAIEKRLLGHDFASDPISKRLERLEIKAFGHVSTNDDLSDRLDALKAKTGVDVANTPPPGSDWADDDDRPLGGGSVTYYPATTPYSDQGIRRGSGTYGGGGGSSSPSSGYSSGGGSYGMGGSSSRTADGYKSGGSYGYSSPKKIASAANPIGSGFPKPAPDMVNSLDEAPAPALGLQDQIALLENELFGKTFKSETIPLRLNRLESTVFPGQKPTDMAMPDRVRRLTDAVPVSASPNKRVAQRAANQPPADMQDMDPDMPKPAPQRSGFSKIMNGLGNLITGGGGAYGSYPVGSNLVTDPQTGLLLDRFSGNLIDPNTGMVVGRSGSSMGAMPMGGGYGGFNNGLSPIGTPYGVGGSGMRFGFGGSGIRFGGPMGAGMGTGMGAGIYP